MSLRSRLRKLEAAARRRPVRWAEREAASQRLLQRTLARLFASVSGEAEAEPEFDDGAAARDQAIVDAYDVVRHGGSRAALDAERAAAKARFLQELAQAEERREAYEAQLADGKVSEAQRSYAAAEFGPDGSILAQLTGDAPALPEAPTLPEAVAAISPAAERRAPVEPERPPAPRAPPAAPPVPAREEDSPFERELGPVQSIEEFGAAWIDRSSRWRP